MVAAYVGWVGLWAVVAVTVLGWIVTRMSEGDFAGWYREQWLWLTHGLLASQTLMVGSAVLLSFGAYRQMAAELAEAKSQPVSAVLISKNDDEPGLTSTLKQPDGSVLTVRLSGPNQAVITDWQVR